MRFSTISSISALGWFLTTPLWSATYVSTLNQAPQSFSSVYEDGPTFDQWGMPFTTGSASYELDAITLSLRLAQNGGPLTASLYAADVDNLPTGIALDVAFSSGSVPSGDFGQVSFTPNESFLLQANTTYVFVLSAGSGAEVEWRNSTDVSYDSLDGWTLPEPFVMAYRTNQFGSPEWGNGGGGNYHFMGAVSATAIPEPGAATTLAGLGALCVTFGLRRQRRG